MALDPDQLPKVADAFIKSGFSRPTMGELAVACGFSRRALYYHYRNKEELFRDIVRYQNESALYAGWTAGMNALMRGGDAITVITTLLDTRFGENRRAVAGSPHALELADAVFRLCDDIIIEFQGRLQEDLVKMLEILHTAGKATLQADVDQDELAVMLAAAVRGVNQARPHLKEVEFQPRYLAIIRAILRGSIKSDAAARMNDGVVVHNAGAGAHHKN